MTKSLDTNKELEQDFKALTEKRSQANSYKSFEEIKSALKEAGNRWRSDPINKKGNGDLRKMTPAFCTNLILKHTIIRMIGNDYDNALLGVYDPSSGIYDTKRTTFHALARAVNPFYLAQDRNEVIKNLKLDAPLVSPTHDPHLVPVDNGIYNLERQALLSFSPDYVYTAKISTPYPTGGISKDIEDKVIQFLDNYNDGTNEMQRLLLEVGQDVINPNYTHGKLIFLLGYGGSNGKSTFQQLLINTIGGNDRIASLAPSDFEGRFDTYSLIDKVANIADDVDGDYIKNNGKLKSIATGNVISVEKKGGDTLSVSLNTTLLFSANNMVTFKDKSGGIIRRLLIIPFDKQFSKDHSISQLINDPQVQQCFLKMCLDIGVFDEFITPQKIQDTINDYINETDYIKGYITEVFIPEGYDKLEKIPAKFLKAELKNYKESNDDYTKVNRNYIKRFMHSIYQLKGITYHYQKIRISTEEKENLYPKNMHPYIEAEKGNFKGLKKD